MSDSPFLSVIVATFNRSKLIGRAIQSMLDQTYSDWELIIIDDGSTDETKKVVNQIGDYRIRYYYQENEEKSVARNLGIEKARGKYLSFLDDDDYYLPGFVELFFDKIKSENNPVALTMCDEYVEYNKGKLTKNIVPVDLLNNPVRLLWEMQSSIRPFVIHRDILEKEKFDERFTLGEDFHLLIRIALQYPFYYLPVGLSVQVIHQDQISQSKFKFNLRGNALISISCIDDLIDKYRKDLLLKIPRRLLYDLHNHIVYGFGSAAMKQCDFSLLNEILKGLSLKATISKTLYYCFSLLLRAAYYAMKCLISSNNLKVL